MKKIILSIVLLFVVVSIFPYHEKSKKNKNGQWVKEVQPQQGDIKLEIYPTKKFYSIDDEITLLGRIINLSDKSLDLEIFDPRTLQIQYNIIDPAGNKLKKRSMRDVSILEAGEKLSDYKNVAVDIDSASSTMFFCPIIDKDDRVYDEAFGLGFWYKFPEPKAGLYKVQALYPIGDGKDHANKGMYYFDPENPPGGFVYSNTSTFNIVNKNDIINAKVEFEPHKWNMKWRASQPEGYINCWVGNIDGYDVKDINLNEIYLNGYVKPVKIKLENHHKDFKGKIIHLQFSIKDIIWAVGEIKYCEELKTAGTTVDVQGKLNDGKAFNAETNIALQHIHFGREK